MWVQLTSLQIVTDKGTYQLGDTAQVMIQASRTPTIVWLTVGTDRVQWSKQVKIQDAGGAVGRYRCVQNTVQGYTCAR